MFLISYSRPCLRNVIRKLCQLYSKVKWLCGVSHDRLFKVFRFESKYVNCISSDSKQMGNTWIRSKHKKFGRSYKNNMDRLDEHLLMCLPLEHISMRGFLTSLLKICLFISERIMAFFTDCNYRNCCVVKRLTADRMPLILRKLVCFR